MHCVYHRPSALCATQEADAPSGPVLSRCQSACGNIAHTDPDIANVNTRIDGLEDDPLAPPIRYHRARTIADQLRSTVAAHEESRPS